jgi:hypothetical protein
MQKIKSGKEEIVYLLTKAIDKYKTETGQQIVQNTNRKNYESLAILLSEISNQLPDRFEELGADSYSPDLHQQPREYPHRKYDITGGQLKDALTGIVSHPRPFLVDACYVYLYGIGRKAFKENPVDENLLDSSSRDKKNEEQLAGKEQDDLREKIIYLQQQDRKKRNIIQLIAGIMLLAGIALVVLFLQFNTEKKDWQTLKKDMNILPYQPTAAEIDSLEGIWLCYTGSPQARISDPARYHKVVSNLIDVKYNKGYFTYNRFGASFNHIGFMQFESPGIVSVYSRIKNNSNNTESPRHSLLDLDNGKKYLPAISASWNFDVGDRNKIIGIREIYIKLGKGGRIEEVINEIENASCQCKVIRWHQPNQEVRTFYLKNQLLDSLPLSELRHLIDENSILLSIPQQGLVIATDSTARVNK